MSDKKFFETDSVILDGKNVKPKFHFSCPKGWMNDPNGFSFFNGEFHLYYQHYPFDTKWGPMHWGHATSKDLLHWTDQPIALYPESLCDNQGCFSGTALTENDIRFLSTQALQKIQPTQMRISSSSASPSTMEKPFLNFHRIL